MTGNFPPPTGSSTGSSFENVPGAKDHERRIRHAFSDPERDGYRYALLAVAALGSGEVTVKRVDAHQICERALTGLLDPALNPPLSEALLAELESYRQRHTLSNRTFGLDFSLIATLAVDHDATYGRAETDSHQALVEQMGSDGAV